MREEEMHNMKLNCANRKRSSDEENIRKNWIKFSWEYTLILCSILPQKEAKIAYNSILYSSVMPYHFSLHYTTLLVVRTLHGEIKEANGIRSNAK